MHSRRMNHTEMFLIKFNYLAMYASFQLYETPAVL